ncbi:MAG TPA: PIG-L family deacetylase [Gaiellales bacterium]|jgi:LmbE family N-acetylglucosaminyl deacetylase|nr:PIG-L family deacetylase [Gaiellales bacterium]
MTRTVLHLSPHPDDEVVGMPGTLMALRDAGWRIVNLACGLGRPAQHQRRRSEVEEACRRAGFELLPCEPPLALSAGDDLAAAEETLVTLLAAVLPALEPALVCAPSPHDGHHAHEAVGRAARRALEAHPGPTPPLWLWGVWADLPFPTLITPFDGTRLAEIKHALAAHESELARLPLDRMVEARAVLAAGVGEERVYGSGLASDPALELAELVCEVVLEPGGWRLGSPRRFDAAAPLASPGGRPIGWWLEAESAHARLRRGT